MDRANLKKSFATWRMNLPKDAYKSYHDGCEKLKKFTFRKTYKNPLKALKEKMLYENEKDAIYRMLGIKRRYIKFHWKEYFNKWRSQVQKMRDRDIQHSLYLTLLNTM